MRELEVAHEILTASDGNKLFTVYLSHKVRGRSLKTARIETSLMILELEGAQA